VPPGAWLVKASLPGVGYGWVRVQVGDTPRSVEFRLAASGTLRVVVHDTNGLPRPDVLVTVIVDPGVGPELKELVLDVQPQTGPDGSAEVPGCPSGPVTVVARGRAQATVVAGTTTEVAINDSR
jgi:hypothetical protein